VYIKLSQNIKIFVFCQQNSVKLYASSALRLLLN